MAESGNLIFLDTDVLINWLVHEKESSTGKLLWPAVEKILLDIQAKKLKGATSIISIMELRSFLRRNKRIPRIQIETEIAKINSLLNILVPNDITILFANQLQVETTLTPIDAIQLALAYENLPALFVCRDKELRSACKKLLPAVTPEELLSKLT